MKRKQERKAQDPHARRTSIEKRDDFNLSSKLESLLKYLALCPRDARKLLSDVKPFLNEDALARMEKSVRFFFFLHITDRVIQNQSHTCLKFSNN